MTVGRVVLIDVQGGWGEWLAHGEFDAALPLIVHPDLAVPLPECECLVIVSGPLRATALVAMARQRDAERFVILLGEDADAVALVNGRHGADALALRSAGLAGLRGSIMDGCAATRERRHDRSRLAQLGADIQLLQSRTRRLEAVIEERTAGLEQAQQLVRQQNAEMVRLETQALVSQIARGLAHELNNPLAAILGYAQRLRRSFATEPEAVRRLDVILAEVDRCHSLVDQLRSLATPLEETPVRCQPGRLLGEAVARRLEAGLPVPGHAVDEPIPDVLAAPQSLLRVFDLLLDNAALAGATCCVLRGTRELERVRLSLANDGLTPAENTIRNATRPFFTTMADSGHRGLGLASATAILRDQHGTLDLAARGDGPGAQCVLTLPGVAGETPSSHLPALTGQTVLVVDDEPLVAELLLGALDDDGLQGRVVGTLREALEAVRSGGLRALIIDVCLPDGNGVELLRQVLALRPELTGHVALVTGSTQGREALGLTAADQMPLLTKPFRMEQITRLVRSIT